MNSLSLSTAARLPVRVGRVCRESSTEVNTVFGSSSRLIVKVACLFSRLLTRRTRQIEPGRCSESTFGRIETLAAFPSFVVLLWTGVRVRVVRAFAPRSMSHWYVPLPVSRQLLWLSFLSNHPRPTL